MSRPLTLLGIAATVCLATQPGPAVGAAMVKAPKYSVNFIPYTRTVSVRGKLTLELRDLAVYRRGSAQYRPLCAPRCKAFVVKGRRVMSRKGGITLFRLDWLIARGQRFVMDEGEPGAPFAVFVQYQPTGGLHTRLVPAGSGCLRMKTIRGRVHFGARTRCPKWWHPLTIPPPPPPNVVHVPIVTITSGPSGVSASTIATFTYSADEPGSSFVCLLDDGAARDCSSGSVTYAGLSLGAHSFSVYALKSAHQGPAATRTWTIAITPSPGNTAVATSTGSGFNAPEAWSAVPFVGSRATLACDVNGDAKADLVAVDDSNAFVMLSTGSGFGPVQTWSTGTFYGSRATLCADVNGDGKADLVAVDDSNAFVMLSSGSGFGPVQAWSTGTFYGSRATLACDVNGDGKADLVAVDDSNAFVMLSTGSALGSLQTWSTGPFYGTDGTLCADVNGNGRSDLVAISFGP